MSLLHNDVFDNGLTTLQAADELWVLSGADEPVDYAAALALRCGIKTAPVIGTPVDGTVSGRRAIVSEITDGEMTVTTTGTRWCLVDTVEERLLTCRKLTETKPFVVGSTFALGPLSITIPDPLPEV
jgi:hypothetical protein